MAQNTVGKIPEFTQDETGETGIEEVKESTTEEVVEEKETPSDPPTEEKPSSPPEADVAKQEKAIHSLQEERANLIKEIVELRGSKREIKQEKLQQVEQQIDELKDVNPDDVNIINRVLRAKGFVTKNEANQMFYEAVKQEELSKFLDKYPEYKPENDQSDANWNSLQKSLGMLASPKNPHDIGSILETARYLSQRGSLSPKSAEAKKRQISVASSGSGGVQRTVTLNSLDPERKEMLKRGGFTDEDIKSIESRL